MTEPTITFLRTGTFTTGTGQVVAMREEDLRAIVSSYDPGLDPAPVVIGTPKIDDPAYGWASGLELRGDRVSAQIAQIEPTFAEYVRQGQYSSVKAAFYQPDSAHNPKPGKWYLKNIQFDGMPIPPAGRLRAVSFGQAADRATLSVPGELLAPRKGAVVVLRFTGRSGQVHEADSWAVYDRAKQIAADDKGVSFTAAVGLALDEIDGARQIAGVSPNGQGMEKARAEANLRTVNVMQAANPQLPFCEAYQIAEAVNYNVVPCPMGYTVNAESALLYLRAMKAIAANPSLSIVEAARKVGWGGPTGTATARARSVYASNSAVVAGPAAGR